MSLMDRFLSKVEKTEGCWLWTARKTPQGYGRISVGNVNRLAHRVSFELFKGPSNGLHVLHRCDNPSCVNPDHLWLGTNAENVADKVAKGRQQIRAGESNGRSKLTAGDVLGIRSAVARGESQRKVAARFNVAQAQVSAVALHKAWRHL